MTTIAEDLLRAVAYPEPMPAEVKLMETHLSWVFLTETEAFKVKKPVDFGFVDFRTLAARKRACDAEVTLNRRLAKDVYLGVVPVRRTADGSHTLRDEGPVVDYAVHMRRLADATRGDELLAKGALTARSIGRVGDALAVFHGQSRCDAETKRFGSVPVILENVRENFEQTRAEIGRYVSTAEAAELERSQTDFLRTHEALLDARVAAGRVRDGHGDLRLEHLYFEDRGLSVIDCIEFSDRFRFGDTCADVAFLAMDLAEHGRVDLAELLLARYARAADDYDLYALVDFYESYRAYVRAKIATFLAKDPAARDELRLRAEADARRHFLLALASNRRSLLGPVVVAVGGVIASGKSTVAEAIGSEMSAPVIDADRTRKHMLGIPDTTRVLDASWQGAYDPHVTERVYDEVLRRAAVVVGSGRPVVLDASFRSRVMRTRAQLLARELHVPFVLVECRAEREVCRSRLEERAKTASVSDGRLAIFEDFWARFEPIAELPASEHLVLETTRPLPDNLELLRARISSWPRGLEG